LQLAKHREELNFVSPLKIQMLKTMALCRNSHTSADSQYSTSSQTLGPR